MLKHQSQKKMIKENSALCMQVVTICAHFNNNKFNKRWRGIDGT